MTFSSSSRRRVLKLGLAASLAASAVLRTRGVRAQGWPNGSIIEKWQKVVAAADVRID
jgi:hypothetical protein